jgi:hypothetical protein
MLLRIKINFSQFLYAFGYSFLIFQFFFTQIKKEKTRRFLVIHHGGFTLQCGLIHHGGLNLCDFASLRDIIILMK